jgi:CRP-like cAMP-binding protein
MGGAMPSKAPAPPQTTPGMLRTSRLFAGLNDATLEHLASELRCEMATPGQLLITEGEIAAHMFVVLSGEVEVLHKGGGDHDVRVALLGPGDWVGEMAILDVQPRSASVRALASTELLRVTAADVRRLLFEPALDQYAILALNVARELSRRLRVADRVIAHASGHVAQRYVMESRRPPPG